MWEHKGGRAPCGAHGVSFHTTGTRTAHTEQLRPGVSCLYPHSPLPTPYPGVGWGAAFFKTVGALFRFIPPPPPL